MALGVIASIVFVVEYAAGIEVFRPLAMAVLIGCFAFGISYLNNFGKYGDVSYGIYILHFPIIQCLVSLGFFELFNPFILLIAIVIVVVLLGFLSWHFIESRFIKRRPLHLG
jgi:peptidoglycan/LPS O-acetylase OafA/YrhL